ncbi:MAG: sigma-54-dependent Fis family transcriptional regulator [Myxococcota bacterium]
MRGASALRELLAGRLALARKLAETAPLQRAVAAEIGDAAGAAERMEVEASVPEEVALLAYARGRLALLSGDLEAAMEAFDDAAREASPPLAGAAREAAIEALLDRDGPMDASAAAARLAKAEAASGGGPASLALRWLAARSRAAGGDLDGAVAALTALLPDARRDAALGWRVQASLGALELERGAGFVGRRYDQQAMEALEVQAVALPPGLREAFWQDPRRRRLRARAAQATGRQAPASPMAPSMDARVKRLLVLTGRLAGERDTERLLERITDAAVELSGAERGFVLLPDAEGALEPRLVRAVGPALDDPSVAFSRSIAEAVRIDGEPIVTVDAQGDRRLDAYLSVHKLLLRSVACLPIAGRRGVLGVLYLEHRLRAGRFREADVDLLRAFADQAAIALENAQLLATLEEQGAALAEANAELEAAKGEVERVLQARTGELQEARSALDSARRQLRGRHDRHGIIGRSPAMRRVFSVLERVQQSDVPVVIHGASGTGKELVAQAIHAGGARRKGPFVAINCGAIPDALLESELFGHVRGAFTGASRDRRGVLAQAHGGTLLLDEVGDMPARMQVELLRVLQDGRVRPVGGEEDQAVDVRIVSASNKRLGDLVEAGEFREDLYYRLHVVELQLPALKDREEDLPLLVDHFLERIAEREGTPRKRVSREALAWLAAEPWPGNVRQLEHALLTACVLAEGEVLRPADFGVTVGDLAADSVAPAPAPARAVLAGAAEPSGSLEDYKALEKRRILAALESQQWTRARAARELGIPRRTFYRRLKEHGILGE